MVPEKFLPPAADSRGVRIALIFALVAERLGVHYEHGIWLSEAQGASLIAQWLERTRRNLPLAERRQLSDLSDQLARRIAASVSREAGLYISHELGEALDPAYQSDIALSVMAECEQLLDGALAA